MTSAPITLDAIQQLNKVDIGIASMALLQGCEPFKPEIMSRKMPLLLEAA